MYTDITYTTLRTETYTHTYLCVSNPYVCVLRWDLVIKASGFRVQGIVLAALKCPEENYGGMGGFGFCATLFLTHMKE